MYYYILFNLSECLLTTKIPASLPRVVFTANFRMVTGHDYQQSHLHKIGIKKTSSCPLSQTGIMDADLIVLYCQKLQNYRPQSSSERYSSNAVIYWASRKEMNEIPPNLAKEKKILNILPILNFDIFFLVLFFIISFFLY